MATDCKNNVEEMLESDKFKKSLKDAEHVIQFINKNFISLNDNDYSRYADHLRKVLAKLVQLMKTSDGLFNSLYQREHFAGSYPDGLKIGKPTEYDMNLIIKLPVDHSKLEFELGTPSFVMVKGKEIFSGASFPADLLRWVDEEGYLLQSKCREWMESVLSKAFDTLPYDQNAEGNTRCLKIGGDGDGETAEQDYKISYKKSGPAMTLKVVTPDDCALDVDLVPAFQFGPPIWPAPPVKRLPTICNKKFWMIIPKPKKIKEGESPLPNDAREWRMSFLDQERELLSGSGTVKPTIKLLKKLRDSSQIKLSSYAIKTVVLLEMETHNKEFWKNRQIYLFLFMLYRLAETIKTKRIPFYWHDGDDLLKLGEIQSANVSNRLHKIFKDIVKVIETDPYIISEKLLSKPESTSVKEKCRIPSSVRPSLALAIGANEPIKQDENNDNILCKIFQKLEEISMEQKQLPKQILQAIPKSAVPDQEVTSQITLNHEGCPMKQQELAEQISNLEDTVQLMKREIGQLKECVALLMQR